MAKPLGFKVGLQYPLNRPEGLLNILWLLLPLFGWLAFVGYNVRIISGFLKKKNTELPKFKFWDDMSLGFYMILKSIPFFLLILMINITVNELAGNEIVAMMILGIIEIFIVPLLAVNFVKHQTIISFFEIRKIVFVFSNFKEYCLVVLKSLLLGLLFFPFMFVVGLPASIYTKYIFFADFYRRRVKVRLR